MKWIWDREMLELVTPEEYSKRQAERSPIRNCELPTVKIVRGHWRYDRATQTLVPLGEPTPRCELPHIITDEIPPTESLATYEKKVFTSKRKLYDHYKEMGVAVKEKGMLEVEPGIPKPNYDDIRHTVAESLRQLRWNEYPLSEKEKAQCQKEQREFQQYRKAH